MPTNIATVYKYVGQEGSRKILGNRSLRFSRPSELNDPFDLYLHDLFNFELDDVLNDQNDALSNALENDPGRYAALTGTDLTRVRAVSEIMNAAPEKERVSLRERLKTFLLEDCDESLTDLIRTMRNQRAALAAQFQNSGVFCATKRHDNILMWAHYADQHRGVVLGFSPDTAKDSMLRLFEPVRYSDKRPSFYDLAEKWGTELSRTLESAAALNKTLVLTKSLHWQYEQEIRIVIPNEVPPGENATYLEFYPHELVEIYIGCKADINFRHQISAAARSINPHVSIFQAGVKARSFELEFERVQ